MISVVEFLSSDEDGEGIACDGAAGFVSFAVAFTVSFTVELS